MMPQQYCLRWKHHHANCQSMFSQLLEKERFCDVTLYCSQNFGAQLAKDYDPNADKCNRGVSLRAHRVVLASCSTLLASLLAAHENAGAEPVIVLDGASPLHVRALLEYMYTGEMNVHHSELGALLKTAEDLRVKGLSDIRWSGNKDRPPDHDSGLVLSTPVLSKENVDAIHIPKTEFDSVSLNGGPPPLIKLPSNETHCLKKKFTPDLDDEPISKRSRSDSEADDKEMEWAQSSTDRNEEEADTDSEADWPSIPQDISSFLSTRLEVDGDEGGSEGKVHTEPEISVKPLSSLTNNNNQKVAEKPHVGRLSGPNDPRFTDVIKLNDYLQHGRRPQFWEEDYVKRVMESVRQKELEMKQAAEILGVSYGTLYGRYRDVYGCINRPYRVKEFWSEAGPAEVLTRLRRNEMSLGAAAEALSITPQALAGYIANMAALQQAEMTDFELPDPSEMPEGRKPIKTEEPSNSAQQDSSSTPGNSGKTSKPPMYPPTSTTQHVPKNNFKLRVAPIESLRSPPSPSSLIAARPDLTLVPATRTEHSIASTRPELTVTPMRTDMSAVPARTDISVTTSRPDVTPTSRMDVSPPQKT